MMQKKWWLDLEVIGERSFKYNPEKDVEKAKGANRPKIDPKKNVSHDTKIAYYPASSLPPPDLMEPYPTDRKKGLEIAAKAETPEEALIRRKHGGAIPEEYIPNYLNSK